MTDRKWEIGDEDKMVTPRALNQFTFFYSFVVISLRKFSRLKEKMGTFFAENSLN